MDLCRETAVFYALFEYDLLIIFMRFALSLHASKRIAITIPFPAPMTKKSLCYRKS